MNSSKYIVLKTEDIRKYLSPEWHVAIAQIAEAITNGRAAENKRVNNSYFVLNMSDPFAQEAMKAYIRAAAAGHDDLLEDASASPMVIKSVKAAMDAARSIFTASAISVESKLPD